MAKPISCFHPKVRAWDPDFFDLAANSTGVLFFTGAGDPIPEHKNLRLSKIEMPPSIENLGPLSQEDSYFLLSRSLALVGMGDPELLVSS